MAAERTWLAWWRTALGASAGALAVGRFAPELLGVAAWPYILLGCGYASLAVGLLIVGAQRQRELEHALRTGGHRTAPIPHRRAVHRRRRRARRHDRRARDRADLTADPLAT